MFSSNLVQQISRIKIEAQMIMEKIQPYPWNFFTRQREKQILSRFKWIRNYKYLVSRCKIHEANQTGFHTQLFKVFPNAPTL